MSVLDAIIDGTGPSFGIGRRGRRVLRSGRRATGVIVGIKVTRSSSGEGTNSRHYAYALDVEQPQGESIRLGCRQRLAPQREIVHVGSQVVVRQRRRKVIIDWAATLDELEVEHDGLAESAGSWKPLRKPPPAGVEDLERNGERRRIARGRAAQATVLRVVALDSMFGALENVDVDVQLTFDDDGSTRQALLRRIIPPDYAAFLLRVGTVLPVGVDKDGESITIDWVAAANDGTTVAAAPPAPTRDLDAPPPPTASEKLGDALQGMLAGAIAAGGLSTEAPEGAEIDFDTWVEVSAGLARDAVPEADHDAYATRLGVPPGRWADASRAWQVRASSDWRTGARYGEAYQQAFQREP
ncbi:MAG: hypothetical protein Q8O56_15795 [Solirubrobacteraceae bacterium]|nr:hypothetical protein [Solirubrobacteraceae bacterium]